MYANGRYHSIVTRCCAQTGLTSQKVNLRGSGVAIHDTNALRCPPRPTSPVIVSLLGSSNVSTGSRSSAPLAASVDQRTSLVLYFRHRRVSSLLRRGPLTVHGMFLFGSFIGTYGRVRTRNPVTNSATTSGLVRVVSYMPVLQPFLPATLRARSPRHRSHRMFRHICTRVGRNISVVLATIT